MRHWAEEVARDYLEVRGYRVLAENYVVRGGEIDLVMDRAGETIFVEVRQRRNGDYGSAAETLIPRKLARVQLAARVFLMQRFGREDLPVRFDAVLVHGTRQQFRVEHLAGII